MKPNVLRAEEAQTLSLYDVHFRYGITSEQSDGQLSLLEVTIPPRMLVKPHVHTREDEFTLVLAGPIGVRIGDETVEELPAGSCLVKPRDVPHALWNVTDQPARIIEVVAPGGVERYFEELAPVLRESGPEWTKRYKGLTEKYGLTVLDDWSNELKARYGITL